jgi:hypothetical protein
LKNEKERKSCILENIFHVEVLRPHREKVKRKKKKNTKQKRRSKGAEKTK